MYLKGQNTTFKYIKQQKSNYILIENKLELNISCLCSIYFVTIELKILKFSKKIKCLVSYMLYVPKNHVETKLELKYINKQF